MQLLWQLLPGAREARNQIILGYAWLAALALVFGIPEPAAGSELHQLIEAVGRVGTGVAVSFVAFLLGSLFEDAISSALGVRGGRAFSRDSQLPPLLLVTRMEDSVRAELERLEASIDRVHAEVLLRVGLVPPIVVIAIDGARDDVMWVGGGILLVLALSVQALRRLRELRHDLKASEGLRLDLEEDLLPEAFEHRRQRQARAEEEARRQAEEEAEEERREQEEQIAREAEKKAAAEEVRVRLEAEEEERLQLEDLRASNGLSPIESARLDALDRAKEQRERRARELEEKFEGFQQLAAAEREKLDRQIEETRTRRSNWEDPKHQSFVSRILRALGLRR